MKFRFKNSLVVVVVLSVALIVAIILRPAFQGLRLALGIPFLVFFPGYALTGGLFPGRDDLSGAARVGLSFGLSLAVVAAIGFILNYTPGGLGLESVLCVTAAFILVAAGVAFVRQRQLPPAARFRTELAIGWPGCPAPLASRALSLTLVAFAIGALVILGYALARPQPGERFTEFYILDNQAAAADYPRDITVGETAEVIVGVVNREHRQETYRVAVAIDGVAAGEVTVGTLGQDERWMGTVGFTPTVAGAGRKVAFLLYRQGGDEVYRELHLWLNVDPS